MGLFCESGLEIWWSEERASRIKRKKDKDTLSPRAGVSRHIFFAG